MIHLRTLQHYHMHGIASQITCTGLFDQQLTRLTTQKTSKLCISGPSCESNLPTNISWIPLTNGQWCRKCFMMTSNGNIFHVTGPLWGEFTSHRWWHHSRRPATWRFDVSLNCAWINGQVKSLYDGDLRHCHTHYDVTVMPSCHKSLLQPESCWQPS